MAIIYAFYISSILPIILLFIMVKDEKTRRLLGFFIWGITAYILSLPINDIIFSVTGLGIQKLPISTGPLVEEGLKMLPLLYIFLFYFKLRDEIISLGMASGIGFAIQENIQYILTSSEEGMALISYIALRSISTCVMHGLATAIVGYGIYLMSQAGRRIQPVFFAFFSMAVIFHALFNLLVDSPYYPIGTAVPIILYLAFNVFVVQENKAVSS